MVGLPNQKWMAPSSCEQGVIKQRPRNANRLSGLTFKFQGVAVSLVNPFGWNLDPAKKDREQKTFFLPGQWKNKGAPPPPPKKKRAPPPKKKKRKPRKGGELILGKSAGPKTGLDWAARRHLRLCRGCPRPAPADPALPVPQ